MSPLLERPGRFLAALEALAFWPPWIGLALTLSLAWEGCAAQPVLGGAVTAVALAGLVAFIALSPSFLPHHARRGSGFWMGHAAFALFGLAVGVRWYGWQDLVMLASATIALAAALVTAAIAWRVERLPSGPLCVDADGVRLETADATYLLGSLPPGCDEGDVLTLLELRDEESAGDGPYRRGRSVLHATRSWRVDGAELSSQLRERATGLLAWAMASALWALV
ncbi:MAG: hypothetical protein KF901_06355 [Myxococcales bacterium]|nr:hypothetical protein [Myxococcales bacterium]